MCCSRTCSLAVAGCIQRGRHRRTDTTDRCSKHRHAWRGGKRERRCSAGRKCAKHRAVHLLAEIKRDAWRSRGCWLVCCSTILVFKWKELWCCTADRRGHSSTRAGNRSCFSARQKLLLLPSEWCALRLTFWCAAAIFLLDAGQVSLVVTEDGVEVTQGVVIDMLGDPVAHRAV